MRITYSDKKVERYFNDYSKMQKRIPYEWTKTVKKHIERLKAAETFDDFLKLNLGHPEPLSGDGLGKYSIRITGNVRLIIKPLVNVVNIEGVVDYHGSKENWFIS